MKKLLMGLVLSAIIFGNGKAMEQGKKTNFAIADDFEKVKEKIKWSPKEIMWEGNKMVSWKDDMRDGIDSYFGYYESDKGEREYCNVLKISNPGADDRYQAVLWRGDNNWKQPAYDSFHGDSLPEQLYKHLSLLKACSSYH